jgi:hypothetical protein
VSAHRLTAEDVWLPGPEPVGFRRTVALDPQAGHWHRYWRCAACGAERDRPGAFDERCPGVAGDDRAAVADD